MDTILKNVVFVFVLSIFDIFGLILLLPIIKIILDPSIIETNAVVSFLYKQLNTDSNVIFVVYLLSFAVIFFAVKNLVSYLGSRWQARSIFRIAEKLTILQFEHYLNKPFEFHSKSETGGLLRSIIEVPFNFANGILLPLIFIVNELIVASIILAIIVVYNPFLFLSVILFIAPFLLVYIYVQKRQLKKVSIERDSSHREMFDRGKQALDGFREITLFDKKPFFRHSFEKSVRSFGKAFGKLYVYNAYTPRAVEGIAVLSVFGIFIASYLLNYNLKITASFLVAFSLAAYRLIPSMNKIILSYNNIKSSEFVFGHFDTSIKDSPIGNVDSVKGEKLTFSDKLEVKNLSFKYDNDTRKILDNLSFEIRKGETIGIVGESGSGKTTLLNIILLLLQHQSGKILVDGREINNDCRKEWYDLLSYVPQNIIIIAGSLLENITFGIPKEEVDLDRLQKVIEQSQLEEFIRELPDGLDTNIGEFGSKISGGQKQRIGIARALYHNGSILLFDESTSSLDTKTAEQLTLSIRNLSSRGYTIIIIAHRIESLRYCDSIFKIGKGSIQGPFLYEQIR